MGMVTSGWVWFVMDSGKRFAIIPTYGSGTAIVRSRQQMLPQGFAPSIDRIPNSGVTDASSTSASVSPAPGSLHLSSKAFNANSPPLQSSTVPASHPFDPQGQTRQFGSQPPSALDSRSQPGQALFEPSGQVVSTPTQASVGATWTPHETQRMKHMGDKLTPLFCLSVHEHAWLYDYGVWGKEEYLTRFWNALDWARVSELYAAVGQRYE